MNTRRWAVGAAMAMAAPLVAGIVAVRATSAGKSDAVADKLVDDPAVPVLGNPLGRVTVVEFLDYRCSYCRAMVPVLEQLLARHKDVRLMVREWPIFGGISVQAARVALAANWQGRFAPVHEALFAIGSGLNDTSVRRAAQEAGVDLARMDQDLSTRAGDLETALGDNTVMGRALGFQGTPGFIVGRYKAPGALTLEQIEDMIKHSARQG